MDDQHHEEAMEDSDTDNSGGVSWEEFVAEWNSDEDDGSDENRQAITLPTCIGLARFRPIQQQ